MNPDKFAKRLNKVLKFSASESDVSNLLGQLDSKEHALTRAGVPKGDHTFRGVLADALQDNGRDEEAAHLRGKGHVIVHNGKVVPGRWTLEPLNSLRREVSNAMRAAGGWEEAHPTWHAGTPHEVVNRPTDYLPGGSFQQAEEDEHGGHDYLEDNEVTDITRHHLDSETGLPSVRGSTFTCHDFECPVHQAAERWGKLAVDTVFHPDNRIVSHLPDHVQNQLEKMITDRSQNLRLEEPDPDAKE